MIPKIIHYCWFGGKELPKDVLDCIKTWKKYCPDYEIKRWDESNFDVNCHPFIKAAYEAKAWAFVSDYARLKVIYDNGGVYLDTDVELLKNIDFLLKNKCYIGIQQIEFLCNKGLGFGAEKSSTVIKKMIECYDSILFIDEKRSTFACPYLNDMVIKSLGKICCEDVTYLNDVTVYPPYFFDPLAPGEASNLFCEDTVSIHHYAASWTTKRQQIKRKLIRFFGEKRYHKLKRLKTQLLNFKN